MKDTEYFCSCDWGTSSFRLRLVRRSDGLILDEVRDPGGAKVIYNRLTEQGRVADAEARHLAFASHLGERATALVQRHGLTPAQVPVLVSGMASSTVGWREVPYATTPMALDASNVRVESMRVLLPDQTVMRVLLVSGFKTGTDMMRGEETEILGLMSFPGWKEMRRDCVVILPGTHAKHVRLQNGAAIDFRTHMTGELFELLATQSLLKVSLQWPLADPAPGGISGEERAEFLRGVALAREYGLGRGLFQVRVRAVLGRVDPGGNTWFLGGLLTGAEMLDLTRWVADAPILLAAARRFSPGYRLALEELGAGHRLHIATSDQMEQASARAHALMLHHLTA